MQRTAVAVDNNTISSAVDLYHLTMRRIDLQAGVTDLSELSRQDPASSGALEQSVGEILAEVRSDGDRAVQKFTQQFDGYDPIPVEVDTSEIQAARSNLAPKLAAALELAADRIASFERSQLRVPEVWNSEGFQVQTRLQAVDRVGLYAPGGRANYPSTVLMTGIPAKVAGVQEVVLCVPGDRTGTVPPLVLAAAAIAQVDRVFRIGGAQAIGAMAFGTESVPAVDVIAGPGNAYVATAKRLVWGTVGIDSFAGPSEVAIIADGTTPPAWIAADLLAQAEHGPGGSVAVIAWDAEVLDAVERQMELLLSTLENDAQLLSTLAVGGSGVLVRSPAEAVEVVNQLAPEHVQVMVENPENLLPDIQHAGAIFCGPSGTAAFGDYIVGVNHVLPTGRSARFSSSLRAATFQREQHIVFANAELPEQVAGAGIAIAEAEGLDFHATAMRLRGMP